MRQEVLSGVDELMDKREAKAKKRAEKATEPKKKVIKLTKKEQQIHAMANVTYLPREYETVWTVEQLTKMVEFYNKQELMAVDTETYGLETFKDDIVGFSMYAKGKGFYVPIHHIEDINQNAEARAEYEMKKAMGQNLKLGRDYVECLPRSVVAEIIKPLLEDRTKKYVGHNCKFDSHVIRNWLGIRIKWHYDTAIGQALLDETQSKRLKDMATLYLKVASDTFSTLFGKTTFDRVPIRMQDDRSGSLASFYAIKDTHLTLDMYEFQMKHLSNPKLAKVLKLMFEIEMPFLEVVIDAEERGVLLDSEYLLTVVAPKLHAEVDALQKGIWAFTGEINIGSPKQLSTVMYETLKLPRMNFKKPDSTDKKTVKKLVTVSKAILRDVEVLVNSVMADSKGMHKGIAKVLHEYIYGRKLGKLQRSEVVKIVTETFTIGAELGGLIQDYRSKTKLTSSFADKLPKSVVDGKIHTSFNSCGTKTGRMSSSSPNLQQIPSKIGGLIRNAFYAREGRLLAGIDFSQQELRVLTHITKDKVLMDIYLNGGDVHSMTGVGMWNRKHPEKPVTYDQFQFGRNISDLFRDADGVIDESKFSDAYISKIKGDGKLPRDNKMSFSELREWAELGYKFEKFRKDAKVVNFGIIYGMSEQGLSETLEITEEEALIYIAGYFDAYPGVKKAMDADKKIIDDQMYVETMMGRKRRLYPEINSGKWYLVQKAYRMGFNARIQGSSADMVKLASIKMQPLLKELDIHIVLWVHDEIIFDVPENIGMENLEKIADIMCNALPLDCGLKSDIEVGAKWGQKMSDDDIRGLFEDVEVE